MASQQTKLELVHNTNLTGTAEWHCGNPANQVELAGSVAGYQWIDRLDGGNWSIRPLKASSREIGYVSPLVLPMAEARSDVSIKQSKNKTRFTFSLHWQDQRYGSTRQMS